MPDFTITISQNHIDLLVAFVVAHNDEHGTSFTTKQFVIKHLKRLVLEPQIIASNQNIRNTKEAEVQTDSETAEDTLLGTI